MNTALNGQSIFCTVDRALVDPHTPPRVWSVRNHGIKSEKAMGHEVKMFNEMKFLISVVATNITNVEIPTP